MRKTMSIRTRISEEDYKILKAILGEKTVSGKVAEIIHEAITQNKNEDGLWKNFERKIETLNTNLSVLISQKQSLSQQSGASQLSGQGKSLALDYLKSIEQKYFKKMLSLVRLSMSPDKASLIKKEMPELFEDN